MRRADAAARATPGPRPPVPLRRRMAAGRALPLLATVLLTAILAIAVPERTAHAQTQSPATGTEPLALVGQHRTTRTGYVSVIAARWAETRLPTLPVNLVTGDLDYADDYLFSAGLGVVLVPDFEIPATVLTPALGGFSVEAEGMLAFHTSLSSHTEFAGALVLRTPEIAVPGDLASVNFAVGNGLSYAFSDPDYEKGVDGVRGVDTVRLQYFISLESELTFAALPNIHFVARVHHRSGIYGLISPPKTGSNYIGLGVRFDLQ